jgi:predicted transcriptional regulator
MKPYTSSKPYTNSVRFGGVTITILRLMKEGNSLSSIKKILNKDTKYLNTYLKRLTKRGLIKRISYGVYEVQKGGDMVKSAFINKDYLRIHNLEISVRMSDDIYRKIRAMVLSNKEFFKLAYNTQNKINYFTYADVTGIITKNNIYIYYPEGHEVIGKNLREAGENLYLTISKTLKKWESKFQVLLFKDNRVNYDIRKIHIAAVNNGIAKEYKDRRFSGFTLYDDEDGKARFTIDFSNGMAELEAIHRDHAFTDADDIQFMIKSIPEYREMLEYYRRQKDELIDKSYIG